MNVEDAVWTIADKGFTERQARFLALVLRHSGVCVMRQYAAFAGVVFGQKTRRFFARLERLDYVSTRACAHNRARIYHVRHRGLYSAIGEPESRLRRPPTVPRAIERLMFLDAMLQPPDAAWLATSDEKVAAVTALAGIPPEFLPQDMAGHGTSQHRRYFPDRLPLGVQSDDRLILIYVVTDMARQNVRGFLQRHAAMLERVPAWTIKIVVPPHLERAVPRLRQAALHQLATPLRAATIDEVRWYFGQLQLKPADGPPVTRDDRFNRAVAAFRGARFPALYRAWRDAGDAAVMPASRSVIADALASGACQIEPLILPHAYAHLAPLAAIA